MVDYTPEQNEQLVCRIKRLFDLPGSTQCRFLAPPPSYQFVDVDLLRQRTDAVTECTCQDAKRAIIKPRPALLGLYNAALVPYTIGGRLRFPLPSLNAHQMCTTHYAFGTWFTYSVDGNIIAKRCTRPTRKQYRRDINRAYAVRKAKEVQC